MSDQLASLGVEFDLNAMGQLFLKTLRWSALHPFPFITSSAAGKHPVPWANSEVFPTSRLAEVPRDEDEHKDIDSMTTNDISTLWETARPWSLGQTRAPASLLQKALGESFRRPGLFMRVDEDTNEPTHEPLVNTGEAIHSSVRVRLVCGGLGMDDKATWTCSPLLKADKNNDDGQEKLWQLQRSESEDEEDNQASEATETEDFNGELYSIQPMDGKYQWVYTGQVEVSDDTQDTIPQAVSLPEEPLVGPAERLLLALTTGQQDVWRYAEDNFGQE